MFVVHVFICIFYGIEGQQADGIARWLVITAAHEYPNTRGVAIGLLVFYAGQQTSNMDKFL